ncbi:IS66 family transposase [Salinispira pacifica]
MVVILRITARPGIRDETTVQVMKEEGRDNTSKSYMWLARGGPPDKPAYLYQYRQTRASKHIHEFLDGFEGYLQTDGYSGYSSALKDHPDIIHVSCFAHARRKFLEAAKAAKKAGSANQAVSFIAKLYKIEHDLRGKELTDEEFLLQRKAAVEPVLTKFLSWLQKRKEQVVPSVLLGKAISYTLNEWPKLIRYIESPQLTPDNNISERAIRPFVLGRKNWLFSGSPTGAESSSAMYSLIETAKANGLDPHSYLLKLFDKAPLAESENDWNSLLPWNIV